MSIRRNIFALVLTVVISGILTVSPAQAGAKLSPVLEQMSPVDADSLVAIVVILDGEDTREYVHAAASGRRLTREERIIEVNSRLRSFRPSASDAVESFLDEHAVGEVQSFFVISGYAASIPFSMVDALASIDGVDMILPDVELTYEAPVSEIKSSPRTAQAVSTNLALLNVPAVWARGYTGKGRLVCSFDTGIEHTHPALAPKWRGNHASLKESWFSPIKPDSLPFDAVGHGTHTMGVMVGSVDADTFGVAIDAEFISAGVVDQGKSLSATLADIILAYEWALDPDGDPTTTDDVPDVILNSWGLPAGLFEDCDATFWQAIDNVEAAGIVTIFSAGNEGPDPKTLRDPADRASTPLNTFSVGAVDENKLIAAFSSRGPSRCNPESVKPEIVAPGVAVRSATKGGGYMTMSGTSMAAPYIAGLVALCRQYNPDATVEEIKNAFIFAAEDLGTTGEDNAYGHGLVDAAKVLDYLPEPIVPEFSVIKAETITGENAFPGSSVDLMIELSNPGADYAIVQGRLSAVDGNEASVSTDLVLFSFGAAGTVAVSASPLHVSLANDLVHGQDLRFELELISTTNRLLDTVEFSIPVGIVPPGKVVTHNSEGVVLSVSDFGQLGLGPGSIYNAGGAGFAFDGSSNLLYEAGIILGGGGYDLSSAVRDADGAFRPSDFAPVDGIGAGFVGDDGGWHNTGSFRDFSSTSPAPIRVECESVDFNGSENDGLVIVRYNLINESLDAINGIRFGFLADFDLPGDIETVGRNDSLGLVYQYSDSGPMVGLVMLANVSSANSFSNGSIRTGWDDIDLYQMISSEAASFASSVGDDLMFSVNSHDLQIVAEGSVEVSFALVAGSDLTELEENAERAAKQYKLVLSTEQGEGLPESFQLQQNYPNPFNPSTTIAFELMSESEVTLEVYNMLGQKVSTLITGHLSAGEHRIEWDGTNSGGDRVATGVYFYRLSNSEFSQSRKMVLLK